MSEGKKMDNFYFFGYAVVNTPEEAGYSRWGNDFYVIDRADIEALLAGKIIVFDNGEYKTFIKAEKESELAGFEEGEK